MVCGNPTIDELADHGRIAEKPGGTALFASGAAAYLGARVGILGNIGEDYPEHVLRRLRARHLDISLLKKTEGSSTRFQITNLNGRRSLRLLAAGPPITVLRRQPVVQGVHLGPVFNEISRSTVKTLRSRCEFLSLDVQGFIRTTSGSRMIRTVRRNLDAILRKCNMVQASIDEARIQTGQHDPETILGRFLDLKVQYAIVTMGRQGSWLGTPMGKSHVPAFPDRHVRDPTGAGDVFAGSWLSTYLSTKDPVWASSVGSGFASLASRKSGLSKFQISRSELFRRAGWVYNHVKSVPISQ
jgi:sugar/nucleoside kinase (ribokinase family)